MATEKNELKKERRLQAKAEREQRRRREALRRRLRTLAAVAASAVFALGLILVVTADGSSADVHYSGEIRTGGNLRSLTLPELEGSGVIDYERFRDKPLVINFFASWCPNCIEEMPDFERVHAASAGRVAFLGISQSDAARPSADLAHETGITYPTAIDANGTFFRATGSIGMPVTLFVKPGGEISFIQTGALDEDSLRDSIDRYLDVPV